MKTIPYPCVQDLQPDGYEADPEPVMCRCGHEQDWHEQVGALWECIGMCESEGCTCGGMVKKGDQDEV